MKKFQNAIDLLQLSEEQAEQLALSILGEVNREEQAGVRYQYDQRTGQEIIVIPSERLETHFASTDFEKESFKKFDEKICRGKENIGKRVEQRKNFEAEKELGDREIQSKVEKEEKEKAAP